MSAFADQAPHHYDHLWRGATWDGSVLEGFFRISANRAEINTVIKPFKKINL